MSKTVLLVDDDVDLVEQNKMLLTEKGFKVETSHTAKDATKKLKEIKADLVILDVMMESRTAGFILAREIGDNHKNLPIIILSGDTEKPNWMGETNDTWKQIVNFIDKPVNPTELVKMVKKILD